ncbi:sensor histidine kinase [Gulosibacter chungangensis]|uniref:histidine kinase n=1 Tax=Gulosibacter chungangensis TaxID=979746 RepID=A0A7J5BFY4_9MICO|nr:HAMP domain-containing sensor histidine kinase [Gulosibacter chungangensis]KAB1645193.1 HAMP domain-containing histidine kinase [Gulosibacter chungangensis]
MRRRVLYPLLVFGLITVCAVLVFVGQAVAESRTQQLALERESSMDQLILHAQSAAARNDSAQDGTVELQQYLDRFYDTFGEAVIVVDGSGSEVASVGDLPLDAQVTELLTAAARAVPQWSLPTIYPWSPDSALVADPIHAEHSVRGAVLLEINQTAARADVTRDWILITVIGLALLAVLIAASWVWTRWVLRPVSALDTAAIAISEQRDHELAGVSGPPELQRLSESFVKMAQSVNQALEQQRGLVADASHQLRTPLAAIRLRIDSLAREENAAELAAVDRDLDRLEYTVERMLTLANAEHRAAETVSGQGMDAGVECPVECVTSAATLAEPQRYSLEQAGLELIAQDTPVHLLAEENDLVEIVEILLDNARKYAGAGAVVTVGLSVHGTAAVLEVADSGPGLSEEDVAQLGNRFWRASEHRELPGTGLGYAIIMQLAKANYATVQVDRAPQGGLRTRIRLVAA